MAIDELMNQVLVLDINFHGPPHLRKSIIIALDLSNGLKKIKTIDKL